MVKIKSGLGDCDFLTTHITFIHMQAVSTLWVHTSLWVPAPAKKASLVAANTLPDRISTSGPKNSSACMTTLSFAPLPHNGGSRGDTAAIFTLPRLPTLFCCTTIL